MKKIVIVTGSPRPGSNSTILAKAFAEGAEMSRNHVDFFDAVNSRIEGCRACKKCWTDDKPCVADDDFNKFAELMEPADVVVFATPVYWGTYPSQLKALVDKFFAYGIKRTKVDIRGNKKFILLACGDGKKETAFTKMIELCNSFVEFHKWEFINAVTVPELVDEYEIMGSPSLDEARELGRSL